MREENQTLATITLQNYFRLYESFSGMTGTAMTEDAEFREIYKLAGRRHPARTRPVIRMDEDDLIYPHGGGQVQRRWPTTWPSAMPPASRCLIGTAFSRKAPSCSRSLLDEAAASRTRC